MTVLNSDKRRTYGKRYLCRILVFLGVISLAFLIITPYGIDIEFHVLRIGELGKELMRGGQFPVYIFKDVYNHYGYPIPIFYGELFLFPFSCLSFLGVSPLNIYKFVVVTVLWASFWTAHVCLKKAVKDEAKVMTGAFIYAINPFFLTELFVRASLGSAMVFVFLPFVLLGFWMIERDEDLLMGILYLGAGMACVTMSHVVSTVMAVIGLVVVALFRIRHFRSPVKAVASFGISALTCFLLTAWYLLPMMEQLSRNQLMSEMPTSLEVGGMNLITLLLPMHLSVALSSLLHVNLIESVVGGCALPLIILLIYLMVTRRYSDCDVNEKTMMVIYFLLTLTLIIPWIWMPLGRILGFMQFSWRIYLIISMLGVFLMNYMMIRRDNDGFMYLICRIAAISAVYVLVFFMGYFMLRDIAPGFVGSVIGHGFSGITYSSETQDILYLPASLDRDHVLNDVREVRPVSGDVSYTYDNDEANGVVFIEVYDAVEDSVLECPFISYAGYTAVNTDTGEELETFTGDSGLVNLYIPIETTGRIAVSYAGTGMQRISLAISTLSAIILMTTGVWHRRRQRVDCG